MIVKINGVDYSNKVIAPTFKITKNSNYQNDCSFNILDNTTTLRSGMELIVFENDGTTVVFGGLIQQPTRVPKNNDQLIQTIKSLGYRQIAARRSVSVDITDERAGTVVETIFDANLDVGATNGEGFTKGTIDEGIGIDSKKGVFSIFKLYTDLAQSSGLSWWVTDEKEFNFTRNPSYTDISKELTDGDRSLDKFVCLDYPIYKEDLSKYRNKQFVIGKTELGNDVIGSAENTTEIARMQALYGSGVYGNIITNNDIRYQADADAAAQAELDAYTSPPSTITFKTTDEVDVNQRLVVTLELYQIAGYFIVDKVVIKFDKTENMLVRTVTLKEHITTAKAVTTWTDDWNKALETTKNEAATAPTEPTHVYGNTNAVDIPITNYQVFNGIKLDYNQDTKVAVNVSANLVCTQAMVIKLSIRVDEVVVKSVIKAWDNVYYDVINLNCVLKNLTGAEIDFVIEPQSGSGQFALDDGSFNVNFVVQYGSEYVEPPLSDAWVQLAAPSDTFELLTYLPTDGAEFNSKVYAAIGSSGYVIAEYDIVTDTWNEAISQRASNYYAPYICQIGSKLFFRGNTSDKIISYDCDTDVWNEATSTLGVTFDWVDSCVHGDYIYVVASPGNAFYRYNVVNDQWDMSIAQPSTAFSGGIGYMATVGGKIYVKRYTDQMGIYDISSNSWTLVAQDPGIGWKNPLVVGTSIYMEDEVDPTNRFIKFDTTINSFDLSLPSPTSTVGNQRILGQYIYCKVYGGTNKSIYRFDTGTDQWDETLTDADEIYYASLASFEDENVIYARSASTPFNLIQYVPPIE